ncbi:PPP family 3-phenylpropionic acid transporter [Bradyrhizobium diazoefficiens]|uniref:MFS transporter n=1 Tax=Bradyrhizobium diazoefficiens TaxID=1355477 RepID=A0A809XA88_9BRAD|nr:major facilitator superfamily domain-containing protein 6 [Bradyrhizobium diazoefficiens]MBR0864466.1 MFS transporter [Bradyrhizobium diazoefficiens]MBR0889041.1 MFS transporter [Bradyrhizobium diazoefficiens]MBR0920791.1 MFS transporter [Bradyrhizobium diazoefficiens]WLA76925.1 major facilitator superfamily domain-containing protein 6 [Bradyrhizobium diazoefficiens]BCE23713.1 MFS transporter [Bradyrhizobium diazoefficiens]
MAGESQIPTQAAVKRRFAVSLALFYSAFFAVLGTHMPFFPVWLKAIGIDAAWIGLINALPAITRFTTLPQVAAFAEKRHAIRAGIMVSVLATAIGFAAVGLQQQPLALFLIYALTCMMWTPTMPLTDAYALRGVARYGLDYGPLRLWGSAAFAAGSLACGYLVDSIAARDLIWVIVAWAVVAVLASLRLQPLDDLGRRTTETHAGKALLHDAGFWAVIASAALIQSSHIAFYTFSAITWQLHGHGGLTIAGLWTLGVIAEIVVFALSPRFSLHPSSLMAIGGLSAVVRWIVTASEPSLALLAIVQLGHGLSFGMTMVGTMNLLVQRVPSHQIARGQGYYAACNGLLGATTSIASGAIYARIGEGLYYVMAAMAAAGALVIWSARHRLKAHPHSEDSGG